MNPEKRFHTEKNAEETMVEMWLFWGHGHGHHAIVGEVEE
ncbi:hypothetical protein A2U01_0092178, partial [Trifolium medium]|nr:hypothetical protein [Trifolium medium]